MLVKLVIWFYLFVYMHFNSKKSYILLYLYIIILIILYDLVHQMNLKIIQRFLIKSKLKDEIKKKLNEKKIKKITLINPVNLSNP
jgi:hypothetical protein